MSVYDPTLRRVARRCGAPEDHVEDDGRRFRESFSGFGGRIYLDCAAQGPFPRDASDAVRAALLYKEHPEEIPESLMEDLPDRLRAAVARLIGCNPANIAIGTGASHGLNIAARGLPLKAGDEVLLPQGEFPANLFPWLALHQDGVRVRLVPPSSGRLVTADDLLGAISPATRVISVSQVAFATGYRIDLKAIGEACRRRDLFFVVDGAQGIGAVDFRTADHPIDLLAVSGYKWLFGPYGTGFTYINPRLLERLRVVDVNWLGIEGSARQDRRAGHELRFKEGARRFDAYETASFLNVSAFAASVEFVGRVRVPTIEAHVRRLIDRLVPSIERTRLRLVSDLTPARRSGIVSFEAPTLDDTRTIYRRLRERGVIVSLRENLIRLSPNIYNTPDDIDLFLGAAVG